LKAHLGKYGDVVQQQKTEKEQAQRRNDELLMELRKTVPSPWASPT
jgi:hypothetical protein